MEKFEIKDHRNKLLSKVEFLEPAQTGIISSMFGKSKPQNSPEPNKVQIGIYKTFENQEVCIAQGDGLWTRYVQFDKVLYWQVNDPVENWNSETFENALPSSSVRRKEIKLISERKFAEADA